LLTPSSREFDIADPENIADYMKGKEISGIIHAAALTNLEHCHSKPIEAFRVNTQGTLFMARLAAERQVPLLAISTDAVFSGNKGNSPFTEKSIPRQPINVYGATKWAGEVVARAVHPETNIARLGWMFGSGPEKDTKFVGAIVKRIAQGQNIQAVTDKTGSLTSTAEAVPHLFDLLDQNKGSIRHLVQQGIASRYEVAQEIAHLWDPEETITVHPVSSTLFPSVVKRPDFAAMSTVYQQTRFTPWQDALADYHARYPNPTSFTPQI
jgi:dTDP-4-dehydrorhamnose reductase